MGKGTITWLAAKDQIPEIDLREARLLDMEVSVLVLISYKDYNITTGRYYPNPGNWVLNGHRGEIEANKLWFAYINYPESIKL